ncbi:unnamed protein product [Rotaria sp. Silwood2]|nr:unnamed protein product [Rotaria sp. Silwood2]CAF3083823.1 unnamed protein product [Rotaria sp. Silwood2]CAF3424841.1 unnamed protein product [Rotaria sp. Silwood2]CAF4361375.1 unnamed protein product [Rotaria sp. Silwood2]CAF4372298.1 unnamed protein product [Rotaria sp. Silwood2]
MAPKKSKEQLKLLENLYVVLRDKSSRHYVIARHELNYNKKDNLTIGTYATFALPDDPSRRCQGTIIVSGSKEQCENSMSLIEKTINNSNNNSNTNKINDNDDNNNNNINHISNKNKNDKIKSNNKKNNSEPNNNNNMNMNNNKKRKNINKCSTTDNNKKRKNIYSISNNKENYSDDNSNIDKNKNNNNNVYSKIDNIDDDDDNERDEPDSDSSNQLFIDDKTERSDDNDNYEESETESGIITDSPISQQPVDLTSTISQSVTVAKKVNHTDTVLNQTELSAPLNLNSKKKRSTAVSHSEYEKMKRENMKLKKEINMYKKGWMPKPSGPAANYFIEIGRALSGVTVDEPHEEEKGDALENICLALDMNEKELKSCEHDTDITKTCRQIIKFIYPDAKERSTMLVSSMDADKLKSIQRYARLVHPAQSKTANSTLNNAIGNVFATDKHRYEKNDNNNTTEDDEEA